MAITRLNYTTDIDLGTNSLSLLLGGTGSANALNDYEEGTWTPSANYGTLTTNYAQYTKIGRFVHLTLEITGFSDTTTASTIIISGLPFSSAGTTAGGVMHRYISSGIGGDAVNWYIANASSTLRFYASANNSVFEALQHADLTSTSAQMYMSVTYRTS